MKKIGKTFQEEIFQPFSIFARNRGVWGINLPYVLHMVASFSILNLMTKWLSQNVGLSDMETGWVATAFTAGVTVAGFLLGSLYDRWGVRWSLIAAFVLLVLGRGVLAMGESVQLNGLNPCLTLGLFLIVIGSGLSTPAVYGGIKQSVPVQSLGLAYATLYALKNLGAVASGVVSPTLRRVSAEQFPPNGIGGVFWFCTALTVAALAAAVFLLCIKKKEAHAGDTKPTQAQAGRKFFSRAWFAEHPLANRKFLILILILIPAQALFAHQFLTLPAYIERAFQDEWVSRNFELVNSLNPFLIILLTPVVTVITADSQPIRVMIGGTVLMALSAFLLALGTHPALLLAHIVMRTVGEALWQPRFLEQVAKLAPEGQAGLYMGVANFPWLIAKVITGLYSGWFLARYCPAIGSQHPEIMWFVYGCITTISPLGLWVMSRRK